MCGLTGFYWCHERQNQLPTEHDLENMTLSLSHRGPDDSGIFLDKKLGIGLGHRRLAIRDLSPLGAQPMRSSCGRFIIVYNGEIYSNKELAQELTACGRVPKGTSDTELIVEAFAEWGVKEALPRLNGMFAIAAFDTNTRTLHLLRDRLGIKPLYWSYIDGKIIFGSELKSLKALRKWDFEINQNSLASFMRHNYIPAPNTIYKNIFKLEPGTRVKISLNGEPKITRYWDFLDIASKARQNLHETSGEQIIEHLEKLLRDSVCRRMVSDVPIGALLSGGIDSSTISALMAETAENRKIKTFSIGFQEKGYDEAPYAKAVAEHLQTEHIELYATPQDAIELVEEMPIIYDEPFADSSQIPTALVSILTKKHVTVVLSGDGGDELFAGYNRYNIGYKLATRVNSCPAILRNVFSRCLSFLPTKLLTVAGHTMPGKLRINQLGHKIAKVAELSKNQDVDEIYRSMISHWQQPEDLVPRANEHKGILWDKNISTNFPNFLDRMQALDTITYLPDDILTKVDRASMAVGLEARVPFLDHRVVEYAWRIPRELKINCGQSKWPLRQILAKRIPKHLIERPKMGFGVPLDDWLRGPLKNWGYDLLDKQKLINDGFLNADLVRKQWQLHQRGENLAYPLWNVLMFQSWLDNQ